MRYKTTQYQGNATQCDSINYKHDSRRYNAPQCKTARGCELRYVWIENTTRQYKTAQKAHCEVQYSATPKHNIQLHSIQYNTTQCTTMQYKTMQHNAAWCYAMPCTTKHIAIHTIHQIQIRNTTTWHYTMQHSTIQDITLHHSTVQCRSILYCTVLNWTELYCNVM